jgi:hypothetical protein
MARDPSIALDDMIVVMDRVAEETRTLTFEQFAEDWRAQYIVERALLIISEASRAIPDSSKEKHPRYPLDRRPRYRQCDSSPICVAVSVAHLERCSGRTASTAARYRSDPPRPRSVNACS